MSEAAQGTRISDNVNQGYIAGRDLYLGDQYVVQETLFFEPDLEEVAPPAWVTTPKAGELARSLATHRLVILAGQDLDDRTRIARHLAWLLRQELSGPVRVREWYRSSDPQKIETSFHETDTTILLLPQVLPHHVGHRLNELTRLLQVRRNYAVITTDGSRTDWGIRSSSSEECLWHEISWETYYGRPFLAETLLTALGSLNGQHPDWLPRNLLPDSPLTEKLTVGEVAARLRQPDRIHLFVEWLQTQEASPRTLLAQLDQLGGDRADIFRWYQQLKPTDQIFALGLVLFDGLPDDQIFAAVEYLVDTAWRRTDPNLPLFDYRDLARLDAYFHLAESGEDGARIETPSRKKREAILHAAWDLQRRRLLAVVPAMTKLIQQLSPQTSSPPDKAEETEAREQGLAAWRNQLAHMAPSAAETLKLLSLVRQKMGARGKASPEHADEWRFTQGSERELFSSARRVEKLQRSVIESLSQIGLLSFEGVEASFLELAAEGSLRVQTVVAKALAAWRGDGHHDKLFQVLRSWWQAGSRTTPPKILSRQAKGTEPLAGIRATVAMTVGYALQYDPPNQLAPELQDLLQLTVVDDHPAVRQRVLELTLPLAAASHPRQLEDLLRERLLQDQEQMYAISFGIAMAFTLHPFGALRVLDNWYVMVRAQGDRDPADRKITPRDRLLAALAMTYGYLRCDASQTLLSTEQVVAFLRSLLATETHPFVRTHALMATGLQGLHDFELVAPLLMELMAEIALPDRANVVSVFVRAYLQQRERLRGGDGEVESERRTYQIWVRSPRPLTQIEASLYSWLRDGDHPVARQIAAQTFAAFAATDLEQKERSLGAGQTKSLDPPTPLAATHVAATPRRLRQLPLLGYAAVHCAAPFHRTTRALVRPVLAEMLDVERSERSDSGSALASGQALIGTILDRWHSSADEEIRGIARAAATALRLYLWRWVIILAVIFCGAVTMSWRDWRWSHQDPLPQEETIGLQQRKILPLRFALTRGSEVRRPVPEPEPARPGFLGRTGPLSDLSDRLLWSSIAALERKLASPAIEERLLREDLTAEEKIWMQRRVLARIFAQLLLDYLRNPEEFQDEQQREQRTRQAIERAFPGAQARLAAGRPGPLDLFRDEESPQEWPVELPQDLREQLSAYPLEETLRRYQHTIPAPGQLGPASLPQIEPPLGRPPLLEKLPKPFTQGKTPWPGEDHGNR